MKNYIKRNIKKIFNQKLFYIILCFLFLIIPIILFILLLLGKEKSAIDSWTIGVGFYGALLGGLGTIIAFIVTSQQTNKIQSENVKLLKEQFYEDKRINVKPFLDINISSICDATKEGYYDLNKDYAFKKSNNNNIIFANDELMLNIKNVGIGPAINIKFIKIKFDEKINIVNNIKDNINNINLEKFNINLGALHINESKFLKTYFNLIDANLNKRYFDSQNEISELVKLADHYIEFTIEFNDILENLYEKKVVILIQNNIKSKTITSMQLPNGSNPRRITSNTLKFKILENQCSEILKRKR